MRAVQEAGRFFLRPIYRAFFERPLWWFLTKVKAFFFAEVGVQLGNIEGRLGDQSQAHRLAAIEERLRSLEASNAAQWDSLEQLLLAMFRQSEPRTMEREWDAKIPSQAPILTNSSELSRVHAASNLR